MSGYQLASPAGRGCSRVPATNRKVRYGCVGESSDDNGLGYSGFGDICLVLCRYHLHISSGVSRQRRVPKTPVCFHERGEYGKGEWGCKHDGVPAYLLRLDTLPIKKQVPVAVPPPSARSTAIMLPFLLRVRIKCPEPAADG